MRDWFTGFYCGFTLYPFPIVIAEPFRGWTRRTWLGYVAGAGAFAGCIVLLALVV